MLLMPKDRGLNEKEGSLKDSILMEKEFISWTYKNFFLAASNGIN